MNKESLLPQPPTDRPTDRPRVESSRSTRRFCGGLDGWLVGLTTSPSFFSHRPTYLTYTANNQVCAKKFIVIVDDSKLVPGLGITGCVMTPTNPLLC